MLDRIVIISDMEFDGMKNNNKSTYEFFKSELESFIVELESIKLQLKTNKVKGYCHIRRKNKDLALINEYIEKTQILKEMINK